MSSWNNNEGVDGLEILLNRTIAEIRVNEEYLVFTDTEGQIFGFEVIGDCCSHSYFYDFHEPDRLLKGNPVTGVEEIALDDDETGEYGDVVACYGYRLTTHDETFGPVSTVFSFRNSSNGYYGGWMQRLSAEAMARLDLAKLDVITETVTEI